MFAIKRTNILMVLTRSMTCTVPANHFQNDIPQNRFTMLLDRQSDVAYVEYERSGDIFDLTHTQVPDNYQGRGIGKIIAKKTFDYIVDNGKRMKLTCEFLQSVYRSDPSIYKNHLYVD